MMSPRITTDRIMVAVAYISVIFAYGARWHRYERLAEVGINSFF